MKDPSVLAKGNMHLGVELGVGVSEKRHIRVREELDHRCSLRDVCRIVVERRSYRG